VHLQNFTKQNLNKLTANVGNITTNKRNVINAEEHNSPATCHYFLARQLKFPAGGSRKVSRRD